ncbi:YheC/YheD family endospore coat-associated protein [Paenibacillus aestuarii]|uniref:YheC/YheD family protein n=1 Tax=Paenibacillus aestuarii TaxID=516965 RepID=A0ABW0K5I1_9BACL|nr:YheC/YheD family protein [Paenibacillus aestuarii]
MRHIVGVLLDRDTFKGLPKGRTGTERIQLYNKAAKKLGLKLFYMSLHQIGKTSALGYTYTGRSYKLVRRSIPRVTHNRSITLSPYLKRKLQMLSQSSIVFNRQNRYDKHRIHKLLDKESTLSKYLPVSSKYSRKKLLKAMDKYPALFIKPTNNSVGNGIMKIARSQDGKFHLHWKKGDPKQVSRKAAAAFIQKKVSHQTYMIQEGIPLATYKGRPYDLRVSVQRSAGGAWQVTGIVGKVAGRGRHVTNVAKGGKVKKVRELFGHSGFQPEKMIAAVENVSLSIARHLSEKLPHLADIGLDMGIDKEGRIKFIEMNGRDQRYAFRKAKMNETFYRSYENPLKYAKFLLNKR